MNFGFKLYGTNLKPNVDLDALRSELDAAKQQQPLLLNNIFMELDVVLMVAATYFLTPAVVRWDGSWYAPYFERRDGVYATDWTGGFASTEPYPPTIVNPITKLYSDPNYVPSYYRDAVKALNDHIAGIAALEDRIKNAYCTIYDSRTIAWNQVDMFLVPAGLTTNRSYPYLSGRTLRATQMFVNTHPQDGTGEAGKALAPLLEISGTNVTVSGGNRDTYVMVVMQ